MHRVGVIHRDLKPGNILLSGKNKVLICDFGLARPMRMTDIEMTQAIQSLWYRAPEALLRNTHYSFCVDYWSIGVIAFELVHGKAMFQGESEIDMILKIFQDKGTPVFDELLCIEDYEMVTEDFKVKFPQFKGSSKMMACTRSVPKDL